MQYMVVIFSKRISEFHILPGMEWTGNIRKMESSYEEVIRYRLPIGDQKVEMNPLIGTPVRLHFRGVINCIKCGRKIKKSFAQGYCYPCFIKAPETEECVLRPELCRAQEGVARDLEYAATHCLTEHVVYIAYTSGIKVGVTRQSQVPTRWIDQGALLAIELARTPNRYMAGQLEVAMKNHMADKTNWRKMLYGPDPSKVDLVKEKQQMVKLIPEALMPYVTANNRVQKMVYPVNEYPGKIKSLNPDKEPEISGLLTGIKGQYLLFSGDRVINIRKYGGYLVTLQTVF